MTNETTSRRRVLSGTAGIATAGLLTGLTSADDGADEDDDEDDDEEIDIEFDDIEGRWTTYQITELTERGVIAGYPDSTFRPEQPVTRAEFATLLDNAFELEPETSVEFTDVDGHWAKDEILAAAESGWMSGYPDDSFKPDGEINRTEVIVALMEGLGYDSLSEYEARLTLVHGTDGQAGYSDAAQIPEWAKRQVGNARAERFMHAEPWSRPAFSIRGSEFRPFESATREQIAHFLWVELNEDDRVYPPEEYYPVDD